MDRWKFSQGAIVSAAVPLPALAASIALKPIAIYF